MSNEARINLVARVAQSPSAQGMATSPNPPISILALAAASYGLRPSEDATIPTGFDPVAVALFEAIVEGAYLVASADGVFDEGERRAFERVVVAACGGQVPQDRIEALVSDLADQLQEDGADRRIAAVAKAVNKKEHAHEVLRIAALLAAATNDVSEIERDVLLKLAQGCGLDVKDVDLALAEVRETLQALQSRALI
jgi:tellurite resistance protein